MRPTGALLPLLERTFFARGGATPEHEQVRCRPDRNRQIIEFRATGGAKEEA
jgi:hypothetical protein